jgi:hypothetical protein
MVRGQYTHEPHSSDRDEIRWHFRGLARINRYDAQARTEPHEPSPAPPAPCRSVVCDRQTRGRRIWLADGESAQVGRARLSYLSFPQCHSLRYRCAHRHRAARNSALGFSPAESQVFCP